MDWAGCGCACPSSPAGLLEFVGRSVTEGSRCAPTAGTSMPQWPLRARADTGAGSGDPAHIVLPGVHRVAALLKRWIAGPTSHQP